VLFASVSSFLFKKREDFAAGFYFYRDYASRFNAAGQNTPQSGEPWADLDVLSSDSAVL
jgi:hypothetical protein